MTVTTSAALAVPVSTGVESCVVRESTVGAGGATVSMVAVRAALGVPWLPAASVTRAV